MKAHGSNGQVSFEGNRLIVQRKGILAAMSHETAGEQSLPLARIQAVEFQSASLFRSGYIRFVVEGENQPGANLWQATRDPFAVMFKLGRQQRAFKELRDAIEKRRSKKYRPG
ncbi:MAG: DUF4429 domain-containing protein [Rhodospirillales bacterium]|nr:DUF4429 domain-containing protein [Rhodospirillales bacterium]